MDSSDSMDENVTKSYSSMYKASSDSSGSGEISKPTSSKQKKNIARDERENNVSNRSKPSSSSSIKRFRQGKEKEEIQLSSKKMKKSTQVDEKSPKKRGYWTPEDEIAFLKGLLAFCEKGKLRNLPKNMGPFFQLVLKDLDGEYSRDQLYNKLLKLRAKYFGVRDSMKDKGFVGFKNAHEEALYLLSKQVWGKGEEEDVGSVKMGKEGSVRVEEKKQDDVGAREEVKGSKSGDMETSVMEQVGEEDEEEDGDEDDSDSEEEEEEEEQGKHEQIDNVGKEVSHVSDSRRNRVAPIETEKSVENAGEETDSEEENVGEKRDSSDESETELSGNENVGEEMYSSEDNVGEEQDSSSESEESENESSGNEDSRQPDLNSSMTESHVKENLAGHAVNGAPRDHSRQNVGEGVSNDLHAFGEVLNGSIRTGTADLRNNGSNLEQHVPNGSLNTPKHVNRSYFAYPSPFASLLSLARQLPALSDKEEEMLDQKWKEQRLFELEVDYKHIALLHEEYELGLAKLRAKLGKALP